MSTAERSCASSIRIISTCASGTARARPRRSRVVGGHRPCSTKKKSTGLPSTRRAAIGIQFRRQSVADGEVRTMFRARRSRKVGSLFGVVALVAALALGEVGPRATSIRSYSLTGISCWSPRGCMAVGSYDSGAGTTLGPLAYKTLDGGSAWRLVGLDGKVGGGLYKISCPGAQECVAIGRAPGRFGRPVVAITRNLGSSWTVSPLPFPDPSTFSATSIDCPSLAVCYIGSSRGGKPGAAEYVERTVDGGRTWINEKLPVGPIDRDAVEYQTFSVSAIHCFNPGRCVATDGTSWLRTVNGGVAWTLERAPTKDDTIWTLSCPSLLVCEATASVGINHVTGLAMRTNNSGVRWFAQRSSLMDYPVVGACYAVQDCEIAGFNLNGESYSPYFAQWTVNGGRTWAKETLPPTNGVEDMACPAVRECLMTAVGPSIMITRNGASWTAEALPTPN